MNSALGIAVVFDFITLIAVETGLEIVVVDVDVDVVGMVDFVDVFVVIGYWLFDVGIVVVVEGDSVKDIVHVQHPQLVIGITIVLTIVYITTTHLTQSKLQLYLMHQHRLGVLTAQRKLV